MRLLIRDVRLFKFTGLVTVIKPSLTKSPGSIRPALVAFTGVIVASSPALLFTTPVVGEGVQLKFTVVDPPLDMGTRVQQSPLGLRARPLVTIKDMRAFSKLNPTSF
jgi:hypothetical protein